MEWISINDRLPELRHECTSSDTMVSDTLLISDSSDRMSLGLGHLQSDGKWICYGGEHDFQIVINVTHWMPLPEPPK